MSADAPSRDNEAQDLTSLGIGLLASHRDAARAAEDLLRQRYTFAPDAKAQQILTPDARMTNRESLKVLTSVIDWTAPQLETALKSYADSRGLKLGKIAQPLRAALTGTTTSPGIFDVLEVLGREESLARIKDQSA